MRADWTIAGSKFLLTFELDTDDPINGGGQGNMSVSFISNQITITLPNSIAPPHPDLLAFSILVAVRPWIKNRLKLGFHVSRPFADMVKSLFLIDIHPVDENLKPRKAGSVPIISFSGGVDSIAASEVFPKNTPLVYYKRVNHPLLQNRAPHVQVQAITKIIEKIRDVGRDVYIIESDLEHICSPYPTLPHWFGIAVGALLMADELNAGLLVMGGTFETYFMDMGRRWVGARGKGLDPLAELVGLPICRPMLGVTEIGTMKIAMDSEFGEIARSCVLGTQEKPCGKCAKCIRKMLIKACLNGGIGLDHDLMALVESDPGIKAISGKPPYYMQAQLEYCLSRTKDLPPTLADVKMRIGQPQADDTEWMLSYYVPASEISIPKIWRELVVNEITKRLSPMNEHEIDKARLFYR